MALLKVSLGAFSIAYSHIKAVWICWMLVIFILQGFLLFLEVAESQNEPSLMNEVVDKIP